MDGATLAALRKEAGLKGYELAQALDISPATLSRYERGHAPVPRMVSLAVRQLCVAPRPTHKPEERLIDALKEFIKTAARA